MKFNGNDKEINLRTHKPEFLDWKWINISDLTKVAVDFKLDVYKKIQKHLNLLRVTLELLFSDQLNIFFDHLG